MKNKILQIFAVFLISVWNVHGQVHCSHQLGADFITSSVSPDYSDLQNCYDVNYYDLAIEGSDTTTYIKATAEITFLALETIDTLVFELSSNVMVDSVTINESYNGIFQHADNRLYAILEKPLAKDSYHRMKVWYEGGLMSGGFFSGISNRKDFTYQKNVTYTLSEPFQSSSWFPVKQDLNDKADSVRVSITTDSTLLAGSNGLLQEKTILPGGKIRYTWESDYPIAYYLISIAIADYIDYSFYVPFAENDDSLLVQNFIYDHPDIFNFEKDRIDKTGDMILLFNDLFGIYPFLDEKYGHAMAPMGGGMEHQTMTTLQTFNFDLVAHELAHQWFGNNVTCGTWQDIWINEGFASYSEYLAREFLLSKQEAIEWMENAHDFAIREEEGSIYLTEQEAKNVSRIFNFPLSYKKGAAILHMLRYEINNDQKFFESLRKFQVEFEDSVAVADDFLEIINTTTGDDYGWFFEQWYYGKGYPVMQSTWKYRSDSLFIHTYQGSSSEETTFFRMHMDVFVEFIDGTNRLIRVLIDEAEESFAFHLDKKMAKVQLDPFRNNLMNAVLYEYIPENKEVEINPNPVRDYIYLNFLDENSSKSVLISDLQGRIVLKKELGEVGSAELNLSGLSGGVYLIVVENGNRKNAMRIIKV